MSKIECDNCVTEFTVSGPKRAVIAFCPFCGEDISRPDDRPLLNSFDDLDEFNEVDYYNQEDDE
jgi:hypothetical protein